jgi:acetyltransferase-like isoleucine patch superfamily enzyme
MGPMAPIGSTNLNIKKTVLSDYSIIATQSIIFPGCNLAEGSVLGAMSLAHRPLKPWTVYFGIPAVPIKKRSQEMTKFKNV